MNYTIGFIYVLHASGDAIKVGWASEGENTRTANLRMRIAAARKECPEMRVVCVYPDVNEFEDERDLHRRLRSEFPCALRYTSLRKARTGRSVGEWYRDTPGLLAAIEAYARGTTGGGDRRDSSPERVGRSRLPRSWRLMASSGRAPNRRGSRP